MLLLVRCRVFLCSHAARTIHRARASGQQHQTPASSLVAYINCASIAIRSVYETSHMQRFNARLCYCVYVVKRTLCIHTSHPKHMHMYTYSLLNGLSAFIPKILFSSALISPLPLFFASPISTPRTASLCKALSCGGGGRVCGVRWMCGNTHTHMMGMCASYMSFSPYTRVF